MNYLCLSCQQKRLWCWLLLDCQSPVSSWWDFQHVWQHTTQLDNIRILISGESGRLMKSCLKPNHDLIMISGESFKTFKFLFKFMKILIFLKTLKLFWYFLKILKLSLWNLLLLFFMPIFQKILKIFTFWKFAAVTRH